MKQFSANFHIEIKLYLVLDVFGVCKQKHTILLSIIGEFLMQWRQYSIAEIIHRDLGLMCPSCWKRLLPIIVSFSYTYFSQSSATTLLERGGIFNNHVVARFSENVAVKDLENRSIFGEYTGWAKKTAPNFSCNNFGKYGPILIMFSLLHSQMNWKTG